MSAAIIIAANEHASRALEGEGYFLKLTLANGQTVTGAGYAVHPTDAVICVDIADDKADSLWGVRKVWIDPDNIIMVEVVI